MQSAIVFFAEIAAPPAADLLTRLTVSADKSAHGTYFRDEPSSRAIGPPHFTSTAAAEPLLANLEEVGGLTKTQAEAFLDWLELQGCKEKIVTYQEGDGFIVRYRMK